jgi:hypothetical protein
MPTLKCLCGESISLSVSPNEHEFLVLSDCQYEQMQEALDYGLKGDLSESQRRRQISIIFTARRPKPEVIECPACRRLAIFRDMSDRVPAVWYSQDVINIPMFSLHALFPKEEPSD